MPCPFHSLLLSIYLFSLSPYAFYLLCTCTSSVILYLFLLLPAMYITTLHYLVVVFELGFCLFFPNTSGMTTVCLWGGFICLVSLTCFGMVCFYSSMCAWDIVSNSQAGQTVLVDIPAGRQAFPFPLACVALCAKAAACAGFSFSSLVCTCDYSCPHLPYL